MPSRKAQRRAATIAALHQQVPDVDPGLAAHIYDKQIAPRELADELRAEGVDVEVGFVNTNPAETSGHQVTCQRCGRTARLMSPLPAGRVAVCPDCARRPT